MDAKEEIANLQRKVESGDMPEYEPLFVLRAQDLLAADVVLIWASLAASRGTPPEKIDEARQLAFRMKQWSVKQVPGRPETQVRIHRSGQ